MTQDQFNALCEKSKVTDIKPGYEIEIAFDDGTTVNIGVTTDHGCPYFTFETNKEIEQMRADYEKRQEKLNLEKQEKELAKNNFIEKYGQKAYEDFNQIK